MHGVGREFESLQLHQTKGDEMNTRAPRILALDVGGLPMEWINFERAAKYYAEDLVSWELGDTFKLFGGHSGRTGERTTLEISNIIAVKGLNGSELYTRVPELTNKTLFARDLHVCAYCGERYSSSRLTRDHVHPRSKGGPDTWNNVVTACLPCNNKKADRDINDIDMNLLYVPYTPNRAEHLILSNRNILDDQMEYLLKLVSNEKSRVFQLN